MNYNRIIEGDCIDVFHDSISEGSVDLIFADPPYNLSGSSLNFKNKT